MNKIISFFEKIKTRDKLIIAAVLYTIIFSFYSIMRHIASYHSDPDMGIFTQGYWTTLKYGMPFYNTFEDGSHFRIHFSPIFYLLLPFFAIYPESETLVVLQTMMLAIGVWPLYLIAKKYLSENGAFLLSLIYLLYHPLQGVNYDAFHELSFIVTPLLFAIYFFQEQKYRNFWLCMILVLSCKEDTPLIAASFGVYGLFISFIEWRKKGEKFWVKRTWHSIALIIVGIGLTIFLLNYFLPQMRCQDYYYFKDRYAKLGDSFGEAIVTIITKPWIPLSMIMTPPKILYLVELLLPVVFLPLRCLSLFLIATPTLAANLLDSTGIMSNTGGRYAAPLIPFIFAASACGLGRILQKAPADRRKIIEWKWLRVALILTILSSLTIGLTPFSLCRPVPKITEHQKIILEMTKQIPDEVPVSTHAGIYQHLVKRINCYCNYSIDAEYIIVDTTSKEGFVWGKWPETLPLVLKSGKYDILEDKDGILLMKKK